jgi:hypothetical protein
MKLLRIVTASLLVAGMSTSAFAEDLSSSIAKAVQNQRQIGQNDRTPRRKVYLWGGAVLFAGGMTTAVYGFMHNEHTGYPTYGEATATNVKLGAAGIGVASAGGLLLFLGQRAPARRAASLAFGPGRVTLVKHVSW